MNEDVFTRSQNPRINQDLVSGVTEFLSSRNKRSLSSVSTSPKESRARKETGRREAIRG